MELRQVELMVLLSNASGEAVWTSVDIDKETSFSFNMQVSDIVNPTAVKNNFSFTVSLPMTETNKAVFSNIEQYSAKFYNFDNLARTEFRLYINNNIYQQGYFQVENTILNNSGGKYNIRLYGGLGDYFYTLSDTSEDGKEMYIKNLEFGTKFNHRINSDYVKKSFELASVPELKDNSTAANANNPIFGYAMTYQGQYENFDSDSVIYDSDDLQDVTWTDISRIKYNNVPDLNEHRRNDEIKNVIYCGDYVSYYQRPMVRLRVIFEKIKETMESKGWKTNLDETFFNKSNVYWHDVWAILPQYNIQGRDEGNIRTIRELIDGNNKPDTKNKIIGVNTFGALDETGGQAERDTYTQTALAYGDQECRTVCTIGSAYEEKTLKGGRYLTDLTENNAENFTQKTTVTITSDIFGDGSQSGNLVINLPYFLRWVIRNTNYDNNTIARYKSAAPNTTSNTNPMHIEMKWSLGKESGTHKIHTFTNTNCQCRNRMREYSWWNTSDNLTSEFKDTRAYDSNNPTQYSFNISKEIEAGSFSSNDRLQITFTISGDTRWFRDGGSGKPFYMYPMIRLLDKAFVSYKIGTSGSGIRSNTDITYSDIIRSEETCFDFLMSYCKPFGMYFIKDDFTKTVEIMTRNTFYGKQEKIDWTNKIDYTKEIKQSIANFDYNIGIFKWKDTNSKYEEDYLNNTSKEYGSFRYNINNGFSDAEKNQLENNIFSNCVIATGQSYYYNGRTTTIYQDNKTLPYLMDSSDSNIDGNFILVFRQGCSTTNYRFKVSDDNDYMLIAGYCWNGNVDQTSDTYPKLRRTIITDTGTYSLYFGYANEVYNQDEITTSSDGGNIYTRFWRDYLEDVYSKDNKILTCYVDLDINDIQTNLFRKFIYINNTPWVLHKITGFNPLNNETTKVELCRVQEIGKYISQKYASGAFKIYYPANGTLIYNSDDSSLSANPTIRLDDTAQTIRFTFEMDSAGKKWTIDAPNQLTISPKESQSKSTTVSVVLPINDTGTAVYWNISISWGNGSSTMIQLIQVSKWMVNATSDPVDGGIPTINGNESSASVNDGEIVVFSSNPNEGYAFLYWLIDGMAYYSDDVAYTVNSNVDATAYYYDTTQYVKISTSDENTIINDSKGNTVQRQGLYFWILQIGQTYTYINNKADLSGYKFESDVMVINPRQSFTRIATVDDTLKVYYNTFIVNFHFNNISSHNFNVDNIKILSPSTEALPNPTGTVVSGAEVYNTYTFPLAQDGVYSLEMTEPTGLTITTRPETITYIKGMDIPQIEVLIENWFIPELSIHPETMAVSSSLHTYSIAVTSNTSWEIVIAPVYDDYFDANPLTGTGNGIVNVTISPNESGLERKVLATFKTTYGERDMEVIHTLNQRREIGTLNVVIKNETGEVIIPEENITGDIITGSSVVAQYIISSIATGNTSYPFEINEGEYKVDLSSYMGESSSGTYSISPDISQSINIVGGETLNVYYEIKIIR